MARAIIRYSFNGPTEQSSPKRTAVRNMLRDAGFQRLGTASFEIRGADLADVVDQLQRVLVEIRSLPEGGCGLDPLWIYVDESG